MMVWPSMSRRPPRVRLSFAVIIFLILVPSVHFVFYMNFPADFNGSKERPRSRSHGQRTCKMTFTTAICGPKPPHNLTYKNWSFVESGNISTQLSQLHVLLKSIAFMSKFYKVKGQDHDPLTNEEDCIEFIVFSDSNGTFNQLQSHLNQDESWGRVYRHLVHITYMPVKYPPGFEDFYTMYKPCATLTVFLHLMLPNLTSVLYLDTDTIFLTNPMKIWRGLDRFSEKHWAGMSPDQYAVDSDHRYTEFYGKSGLNSGVVLLNLIRMRKSQFLSQIRSNVKKFWKVLRSDQDIFNIYFHFHPEEVKELNCSQNFFLASCGKPFECNSPVIEIVHGAWSTFLRNNNREPFLQGIFQCFNKMTLSEINSTAHLHNMLTDCIDKMRPTHMSRCNRFLKTKNIIHVNQS